MTVTQLVHACTDAEWRKRWIADAKLQPPPPTTPINQLPSHGKRFHTTVGEFSDWLCSSEAPVVEGWEALWNLLWQRKAKDSVTEVLQGQSPASAAAFADALKAWCRQLDDVRILAGSDFRSWRSVVLTSEFDLRGVSVPLPSGLCIEINGRPDCVQFIASAGIVVVDYKLSHGNRGRSDMLQLAVYARLLQVAKPGLQFSGRLEYYEPALHAVDIGVPELETIFSSQVLPVLEEFASAHCTPGNSQPPSATASELDRSREIKEAFAEYKVDVDVTNRIEAPQLVRYHVKPGLGVTFAKIRSQSLNLKIKLGLSAEPLIEAGPGYVMFDVPREKPQTVLWGDWVENHAFKDHLSPVAFPVGVGMDGQLLVADLADPNTAHGLVAGSNGSGKSEFLKSVVASLVRRNSPSTLKLSLVDPKRLTFGGLPESPFLAGPVVYGIEDALTLLSSTERDMNTRYETLLSANQMNLAERFAAGQLDVPYRVLVFDEFADLINIGKKEKQEFERLAKVISAKGRAAGIHLIIATQRPDRDVVTGQLKANLPFKVCLRVTSAVNSQIVIDEQGGECLLGRGDLLFNKGSGNVRAQSLFIPQPEFLALFTPKKSKK